MSWNRSRCRSGLAASRSTCTQRVSCVQFSLLWLWLIWSHRPDNIQVDVFRQVQQFANTTHPIRDAYHCWIGYAVYSHGHHGSFLIVLVKSLGTNHIRDSKADFLGHGIGCLLFLTELSDCRHRLQSGNHTGNVGSSRRRHRDNNGSTTKYCPLYDERCCYVFVCAR